MNLLAMENNMRIDQLSNELNKRIQDLTAGKLSPAETNELVELCSDLYEKLIVLRFKAYTETEESAPALTTPISFSIETPSAEEVKKQVNLIDAIAEVEAETELPPNAEVIMEDEEETIEEELIEEDDDDDTPVVFELINDNDPTTEAIKSINTEDIDSELPEIKELPKTALENTQRVSINDSFKQSANVQATLNKKHENTPISDLKKNISLNQRFQFCKDLFKGNNQEYEVILEKLNNTNRDEAMRIIQTLQDKYGWNIESMAAKDFTDLVNRRYLA